MFKSKRKCSESLSAANKCQALSADKFKIDQLPEELLQEVLNYLDGKSILKARKVCKL
jgi:hypothetical protein